MFHGLNAHVLRRYPWLTPHGSTPTPPHSQLHCMQLQLSSSYLQNPSHLHCRYSPAAHIIQWWITSDPRFIQLYKNSSLLMQWSDHEKKPFTHEKGYHREVRVWILSHHLHCILFACMLLLAILLYRGLSSCQFFCTVCLSFFSPKLQKIECWTWNLLHRFSSSLSLSLWPPFFCHRNQILTSVMIHVDSLPAAKFTTTTTRIRRKARTSSWGTCNPMTLVCLTM